MYDFYYVFQKQYLLETTFEGYRTTIIRGAEFLE